MAVPYKRALVLSGGGAKGVFEAGVLKACHHTSVTFDVLTGSSTPRSVDTGAPHGWRCTHTACRVRDVCTRI